MDPGAVIQAHAAHAREHGGNVLFTTGLRIAEDKFPIITKAVIMTGDGSVALTADVTAVGLNASMSHSSDYEQPSQWQPQDKPFALQLANVQQGSVKRGQYHLDAQPTMDLLDTFATGQHSLVYCH